jgi:hypothetical protein
MSTGILLVLVLAHIYGYLQLERESTRTIISVDLSELWSSM